MIYDAAIIGGGPAGLTCALYLSRAGKNVIVIERELFGGKINLSPRVENIPGLLPCEGMHFSDILLEQADSVGMKWAMDTITSITPLSENRFEIKGTTCRIQTASVIIAVGTKERKLNVPGEAELIGKRIHFCATCDGALYQGKDLIVIGGGNTALTDAYELANLSDTHVTILQLFDYLTGEKVLQDRIATKSNIDVKCGYSVTGFRIQDNRIVVSTNHEEIIADGVFEAVGVQPQNNMFQDVVELDNQGFIISGKYPGIFSAGDCNTNSIKQVVTACASGVTAAFDVMDYLKNLGEEKIV